ncbi:response regulator [Breznakiellaceae bacterium SP9]
MTGKKECILLIDDDEIQLDIMENILEGFYTVIKVKSGKHAIEYLLHNPAPSLVLLDIIMPQMDGWETFSRIKALSLLSDVPIVFLTSEQEESCERRAYEIGAADYIKKPYERDEIIKRVNYFIAKNQANHEAVPLV